MDEYRKLRDVMEADRRARAAGMLIDQARAELGETLRAARREGAYQYARLLRASGAMDWSLAPIEHGRSEALARAQGVTPRLQNSAFVPYDLAQRDLTGGTASAGGYLVAGGEQLAAGVPHGSADLLRWCTIVTGAPAGAQQIGRFGALPAATVLETEASAIAESTPATSASALVPRHAGVYVEQSRNFVVASELGAQATVRLLTNALRTHVVTQIIEGTGADGQVLGLAADPAVPATSGASADWSDVCAVLETVETSGGDGPLAWAVTAPAAELLRQRAQISGGEAILRDGRIAGYPVLVVAGTGAHAVFGRWSDLIVYQWAPVEVSVNPFADFRGGIVGVRGWIAFNGAALVNTSFHVLASIT